MSFSQLLSTLYPQGLPRGSALTVGYVTPKAQWLHIDSLDEAAGQETPADQTLYFMPSATRLGLKTHEKGSADDVVAMPALWLDIDYLLPHSKTSGAHDYHVAQMLKNLALEGLVPTAIVSTGGGIHTYFAFEDVEVDNIAKAVELNHRLRATAQRCLTKTGSTARLDAVGNADRLLRPPGSMRTKDDGPRVRAELVEHNPDIRYTLEGLDDRLDQLPRTRVAGPVDPDTATSDSPAERARAFYDATVSVHEVFDAAGWERSGVDGWDHPAATVSPSAVVVDEQTSTASDWPEGVRDMAVIYSGSILAELEFNEPLRLKSGALAQHLLDEGDASAFAQRAMTMVEEGAEAYLATWGINSDDEAQARGTQSVKVDVELGEWHTPDALGVPDTRLPFPIDILPPEAQAVCVDVANAVETPIDLCGTSVLGAYSSIATLAGLKVRRETRVDRCNLWLVMVAEPTAGKSPVLKMLVETFLGGFEDQAQAIRRRKCEAARQGYAKRKERVEKAIRAADEADTAAFERLYMDLGPEPDTDDGTRYITSGTPEGIQKLLSTNGGRLALVSAEGGLFADLEAYQGSNRASKVEPLLGLWSGDRARVARVDETKRRELPPDSRLSQCIGAQPIVIEGMMTNEQYRRSGFIPRFMVCQPAFTPFERKYGVRTHDGVHDAYDTHLSHLAARLTAVEVDREAIFSPEAELEFVEYQRDLQRAVKGLGLADDNFAQSLVGKIADSVARAIGILHFAHGHGEHSRVTPEAVEAGWRLGWYWLGMAAYVIRRSTFVARQGSTIYDATVRVARSILKRSSEEPFGVRDIHQNFKRNLTSEEVAEALEALREAGWIATSDGRQIRKLKRGNTKQTIEIHPEREILTHLLTGQASSDLPTLRQVMSPARGHGGTTGPNDPNLAPGMRATGATSLEEEESNNTYYSPISSNSEFGYLLEKLPPNPQAVDDHSESQPPQEASSHRNPKVVGVEHLEGL